MCFDPLSIAAMALTAGGTMMQRQAQSRAARGVARVSEAEYDRQRGFQQEARGERDRALADVTQSLQNVQQTGAQRGDRIAAQVSDADTYTPLAGSTPEVVRSEIARALTDAVAAGRDAGRRLGQLGGFNDALFGGRLSLTNAGGRLTDLSSIAGGSASVLPIEQQAQQMKGFSPLGDVLSAAGSVAGLAGATGMGPSWNELGGWLGMTPKPPMISQAGGYFNPLTGTYGRN